MITLITGAAGSGKSCLAQMLAEGLGQGHQISAAAIKNPLLKSIPEKYLLKKVLIIDEVNCLSRPLIDLLTLKTLTIKGEEKPIPDIILVSQRSEDFFAPVRHIIGKVVTIKR